MQKQSTVIIVASWIFAVIVAAIGLLNMFWGNDPFFGVFLFLLAFVYVPQVNSIVRKLVGFPIPGLLKIVLGIFIIWVSLGVGELFGKIRLMMLDL